MENLHLMNETDNSSLMPGQVKSASLAERTHCANVQVQLIVLFLTKNRPFYVANITSTRFLQLEQTNQYNTAGDQIQDHPRLQHSEPAQLLIE